MFCCTGCRKSKSKDIKQQPNQNPTNQNQTDKSPKQPDLPKEEPIVDSKNHLESASPETLPELTVVTKPEEKPEDTKKVSSSSNNIQKSVEPCLETSAQKKEDKKSPPEVKEEKVETEKETEVVIKDESSLSESVGQVTQELQLLQEQVKTQLAVVKDPSDLLIEDMSSEQLLKAVDRLETVASRLEKLAVSSRSSGSGGKADVADVQSPGVQEYVHVRAMGTCLSHCDQIQPASYSDNKCQMFAEVDGSLYYYSTYETIDDNGNGYIIEDKGHDEEDDYEEDDDYDEVDVLAPFVVAYDELMKGNLAKFVSLSSQIGGNVKVQGDLVLEAFNAQRSFLVQVSRSKQPPQNQLIPLLNPTSSKIQAIQDIREKNRGDPFFNHLSGISESISALGWVGSNTPFPFIKEMADSALFYTNRVLKDFKEKDQRHVDWARSWIATLGDMRDYTKQYHTTGVSWNPQGGDVKMPHSGPAGFTAPPPPPPPPPMDDGPMNNDNDHGDIDRNALFKELSKGTDITKGLKKVTDDMKTHKNPSLRKGPAPYTSPSSGPQPFKSAGGTTKNVAAPKTPVLELQDKKWVVEHHRGNHNISITDTNLKQTVYAYNCQDCTIQVTGKINSIVIDGCKKTGIVFDDVISAVEFINCERVQTQVTGKVPTVNIEKTDGCMVYLSSTSLATEIVTAKSSEINVLMPQENGDYVEYFIPEQFKSTWNGKSMVTVCSDTK